MKASVITLHTVDNYGSVMQTYATQQILKKCGYDVEFVDYWRKDNLPVNRAMLESSTLQKLKPLWGINGFTRKAMIAILKMILENRKSPMWRFLEEKVQLTEVRYCSYEELEANPPVADVYITGSDQVWNSIWNQGIDRSYFLDFAPAGKPRIAFSASIGREQLDAEETPETKRLLEKYSAISVRELILYFGAVMSVTKKFKLTTGEVNTDIDIMGDEAGNALCDWDGGLIMIDKEATV